MYGAPRRLCAGVIGAAYRQQIIPHRRISAFSVLDLTRTCQRSIVTSPRRQTQALAEDHARDADLPRKKRKPKRTEAGQKSLRKVAVEAQISGTKELARNGDASTASENRTVTAISVADEFDMEAVAATLRSHGFQLDPDGTGFDIDQLVHTRGTNDGDIFVFPSGTVVVWSLSTETATEFATTILKPTAIGYNESQLEVEDLEYEEDPTRDSSMLKGDVIILGTRPNSQMRESR